MNISERVERLRKAARMSLEEVRVSLDVSRAMFHYMRSGERTPSHKILLKLEAAEREAGIGAESPAPVAPSEDTLRDAPDTADEFALIHRRLDHLEAMLAKIIAATQKKKG